MGLRPRSDDIALSVIRDGIHKANAVAEDTLYRAKQAMKLDFGGRRISS